MTDSDKDNFDGDYDISTAYILGSNASPSLIKFVSAFGPYSTKNEKARKLREAAFKKSDANGNGVLSLSEVEMFVSTTLRKKLGVHNGRKVFLAYIPSYRKAFLAATSVDSGHVSSSLRTQGGAMKEDYVSFSEFRLLCCYLCIFVGMYDAFRTVDRGVAGSNSGDGDRKIEEDEWMSRYRDVANHGFHALSGLHGDEEAMSRFREMDHDVSGAIAIKEWCDYLERTEVEAGTPVGKLLEKQYSILDDTFNRFPRWKKLMSKTVPTQQPIEESVEVQFQGGTTATMQDLPFDTQKTSDPAKPDNKNAIEVTAEAVEIQAITTTENTLDAKRDLFALHPYLHHLNNPGPMASSHLQKFLLAFEEYISDQTSSDTTNVEKQIVTQSFVLHRLTLTHGNEEGERLLKIFSPAITRIEKDVGAASSDKSVAILCLYAGMLDFLRNLGGNNDMESSPQLSDWLKSYHNGILKDSIYAALTATNEKDAQQIFQNVAGDHIFIPYDNWCAYLVQSELQTNSSLAHFLVDVTKSNVTNGFHQEKDTAKEVEPDNRVKEEDAVDDFYNNLNGDASNQTKDHEPVENGDRNVLDVDISVPTVENDENMKPQTNVEPKQDAESRRVLEPKEEMEPKEDAGPKQGVEEPAHQSREIDMSAFTDVNAENENKINPSNEKDNEDKEARNDDYERKKRREAFLLGGEIVLVALGIAIFVLGSRRRSALGHPGKFSFRFMEA